MIILCNICGASYETEYKVCPNCGAIHSTTPFYSKLLAVISGGVLVLTLIMVLLGVFSFDSNGGNGKPEDQSVESQLPGDYDSDKAKSEQESESSAPNTDSDTLSEGAKIAIKAANAIYYDGDELAMYFSKLPLQLELHFPNGNPLDSVFKPEWKSSNASVFIVDTDGSLTAVAVGNAKLTVEYGSLSISIKVRIDPNKIYSNPTPPPTDTPTPPPDDTPTPPPDETPTPPPDETPTIPSDEINTPPPDETSTIPSDETNTPPPDPTDTPD